MTAHRVVGAKFQVGESDRAVDTLTGAHDVTLDTQVIAGIHGVEQCAVLVLPIFSQIPASVHHATRQVNDTVRNAKEESLVKMHHNFFKLT